MLRAEKAAMNRTQIGEGVKFMISPSFSSEFDLWVKNGANNQYKTFDIGRTSNALKSIGLFDKPITWDSAKIIQTISKHPEMNFDILKRVPEILENPIIIMKSKQKTRRLTIFGEIISDEKPILAVLELSPKNRKGFYLDEFKVVSSYGKDNAQTFIESSEIIYKDPNEKRVSDRKQLLGSNCRSLIPMLTLLVVYPISLKMSTEMFHTPQRIRHSTADYRKLRLQRCNSKQHIQGGTHTQAKHGKQGGRG